MVSWYSSKNKKLMKIILEVYQMFNKKRKREKRQMCASVHAHSCMHVCSRAHITHTHTHTHTHLHTLTFNDRDWSWDDPKAQNLVSYYRTGLTAKKRTERQECWTNSVLGWMSGCTYTESLYWPISPQTWILWFHGGILLLFLQRWGVHRNTIPFLPAASRQYREPQSSFSNGSVWGMVLLTQL